MDRTNVSHATRWNHRRLLYRVPANYFDRAGRFLRTAVISRDFHLTPETKVTSFPPSSVVTREQIPIGWCADRFNLRWLYAGAFAFGARTRA